DRALPASFSPGTAATARPLPHRAGRPGQPAPEGLGGRALGGWRATGHRRAAGGGGPVRRALYGVLRADPWSAVRWGSGIPPERSAEAYAAVQEHVTRYGDGIPVLFVEEAPHGLMALGGTTLPEIGRAAWWEGAW